MRLEYFEYLIEIARYKNMRVTSEHLHMTPQALSICVKNMEQELGFPILIRKPKGVEFTSEGERLLDCAERILEDYRNTLQDIRNAQPQPGEAQKLLVYITPILSVCLGRSLVERLQKKYPNVIAHIINDVPEDIVSRICESEDYHIVGVVAASEKGEDLTHLPCHELEVAFGFSEELVLAVEKHSSLARKKVVAIGELAGNTMVHCTSQQLEVTPSEEIFAAVKGEMKHIHCNSISLWGKMICDAGGVGPIIKRALQQAFADGDLDKNRIGSVAIEGKPSLRCACIYHQDAPPYIKEIVQEIVNL